MCIYCLPLEEEEEKLLILRENGNSRKSSQMENELQGVNTLIRDYIHPKLKKNKQDEWLRLAEKEELLILRENDISRKPLQKKEKLRFLKIDVKTHIRDDIHPKLMLSKQDKGLRLAEKEELLILRENDISRKSSQKEEESQFFERDLNTLRSDDIQKLTLKNEDKHLYCVCMYCLP